MRVRLPLDIWGWVLPRSQRALTLTLSLGERGPEWSYAQVSFGRSLPREGGGGAAVARYLVVGPAWAAEGPHPNPLPRGEGTGMELRTGLLGERGPEWGFVGRP